MSTKRMMRRFRSGDASAVRELYQQYAKPVFSVAYGALGDRSLAEEAVQQTFLQAWRSAHRFDADKDPAPWLYAIARRVAVDLYRRERRHDSDRMETEVAVLTPSFEGTWETWAVRQALDRLPDDEQAVVRATHFLGLTQRETADKLGVPVGTVKSRLHRAHKRLAGLLQHLNEATA